MISTDKSGNVFDNYDPKILQDLGANSDGSKKEASQLDHGIDGNRNKVNNLDDIQLPKDNS